MEAFIGTITLFGGNFAPRGWQYCNGQLMNISQNTALYSLLGVVFGGDGVTNFALPDLQGRTPIGAGNGAGLPVYQAGQKGGAISSPVTGNATGSITLTTAQLPAHSHTAGATISIPVYTDEAGQDIPGNTAVLAASSNNTKIYSTDGATDNLLPFSAPVTVQDTGNGQPIPIALSLGGAQVPTLPPFLAINYIIALEGIYPSRN